MVDVIVTTEGGRSTALAVVQGGGLAGFASNHTPPAGVPMNFIDWPFRLEDPSLERHVELVREYEPRYAVAPDVEGDRNLENVAAVADELLRHAGAVIVVPKTVRVDRVPRRFVVGLPFRDERETDTGVNSFADFRGRRVHILGGNPTEQILLTDELGLDVGSVDSPDVLAWADFGRVWTGNLAAGDEAIELPEDLFEIEAITAFGGFTQDRLETSRAARITFSVENLVQAWNDPQRRVTVRQAAEPGRGPPPPAPEGLGDDLLETFPGEFESREERLEAFRRETIELEIGRVVAPTGRQQQLGETATSRRAERGGMDDTKRELFSRARRRAQEDVENLGITEDSLPDRRRIEEIEDDAEAGDDE